MVRGTLLLLADRSNKEYRNLYVGLRTEDPGPVMVDGEGNNALMGET